MSASLTSLAYLVAAVLFILALRGLSSPVTSQQGNRFGMIGMTIAVVATLLQHGMSGSGYLLILCGILIGGGIGVAVALRANTEAVEQLLKIGFGRLPCENALIQRRDNRIVEDVTPAENDCEWTPLKVDFARQRKVPAVLFDPCPEVCHIARVGWQWRRRRRHEHGVLCEAQYHIAASLSVDRRNGHGRAAERQLGRLPGGELSR